jgi:transcriptional regulator with XRE-family HTH domain
MASLETFRSFGESLKAARIEQKRSLDDVASAIKINRRHLEAIEAGDLAKLPQGPYAAAFVREYARALGIVVPKEFVLVTGAPAPSPRDPKVVSHPVGSLEERTAPISHVARGTARFANSAVKSAVKSVSKTTGNVVNMVETGGKEALDVLTSKNLWDEAENIRRERHGLPPIEEPAEAAPKRIVENKPLLGDRRTSEEESLSIELPEPAIGHRIPKPVPIRSSRRITNIVIVLLAVVFAGVAYLAIRMSNNGSGSVANKDYIPAPVEKPEPIAVPKHGLVSSAKAAAIAPSAKDSLRFVLRAIQPVWVSIAPDGIPAYRGELKTGEVRSFRAAEKIVVNIGNQKSVTMIFDGAPLSALPAIQNSSVVVRDLVLTRDHVALGGNYIDLRKLTSAASLPKSIVPAPVRTSTPTAVKKAAPTAVKKAVPMAVKKTVSTTSSHKLASNSKSKTTHGKPVKSKKAPKKPSPPPPLIHPVEPIPPRP